MNHFSQLSKIDVDKWVDKKQNLSYLSWPHAVNALMEHDPKANWMFHEPKMFGETMMVSCTVTAFDKPITMHLPVMDHRNQAVKNPDAVVVNKNMMRCLVKAIACHGLGLSVYAGEDLPSFPDPETGEVPPPPQKRIAPIKVEGEPGEWQLKVTTDPQTDEQQWLDLVMDATKVMLSVAQKEADVMTIFHKNKQVFDRVKAIPGSTAYDSLMGEFKKAKTRFEKASSATKENQN